MYSKIGWLFAVAMAIFPFATLIAKLAKTDGGVVTAVVITIVFVFFVSGLIASRLRFSPKPEIAATPQDPAEPIAWSWDGVNRQPAEGIPAETKPAANVEH